MCEGMEKAVVLLSILCLRHGMARLCDIDVATEHPERPEDRCLLPLLLKLVVKNNCFPLFHTKLTVVKNKINK